MINHENSVYYSYDNIMEFLRTTSAASNLVKSWNEGSCSFGVDSVSNIRSFQGFSDFDVSHFNSLDSSRNFRAGYQVLEDNRYSFNAPIKSRISQSSKIPERRRSRSNCSFEIYRDNYLNSSRFLADSSLDFEAYRNEALNRIEFEGELRETTKSQSAKLEKNQSTELVYQSTNLVDCRNAGVVNNQNPEVIKSQNLEEANKDPEANKENPRKSNKENAEVANRENIDPQNSHYYNQISSQTRSQDYYERRKKNNKAAKKSRDKRRQKEVELAIRAAFLERENIQLKFEINAMRQEMEKMRFQKN